MEKSISNIENLVTPTVEALGCRIWGVEVQGGLKSNLKVVLYIESEKGISVDDCAIVSEHVSDILDMEELIPSPYVLEVSSPGLDRILFNERHFKESIGLKVEVRLSQSHNGKRKLKGVLVKYEDRNLTLKDDLGETVIPIDVIRKVRVVPEI